jgi:hypothetical protein
MPEGITYNAKAVSLGPVGRPAATELNAELKSYIPFLYAAMEHGKITPSPSVKIGSVGVESLIEAYAYLTSGKNGNKKVIVEIAEE